MVHTNFTDEELIFGMVLQDGLLFALLFWPDEFSLPPSVEQKMMLTDVSQNQVVCTGRKVAKTLSLERDVLWAIVMRLLNPSRELYEAIFLTPREGQLEPTRDRIFSKANEPFFANLIRTKNRSGGGSGTLESHTGYKWHFRIEGQSSTGENVIGIRARKVIEDEAAYQNRGTYTELLGTGFKETTWKFTGVPNGVRNSPFYDLDTKPQKGWSKHKYPTFVNPLFQDDEAKQKLIQQYGGVHTQGYLTQVLGEWGAEAFSSFPPGSIAIDHDGPKIFKELTKKQILEHADSMNTLLPLPQYPNARYCIGLDYGFSPDPTEIIVGYAQKDDVWHELARITLIQVEMPIQARFLNWLVSVPLANKVVKISTDSIQFQQQMTDGTVYGEKYKPIMHFANVGGTTVITDPDGRPVFDSNGKEVKKRNKQYYTDELKLVFYNTLLKTPYPIHLWLSDDTFLIESFSGMTEHKTEGGYVVYECAKKEEEHAKDALLYLLAAILASGSRNSSENWAELASVMGWVGPEFMKGWVSPWS